MTGIGSLSRVVVRKLKSAASELKSVVIDSLIHRRPTVMISISQLLDLPHCSVKIGPVICMKWDAMLNAWFSVVYERSSQVCEYFQNPYAFLAVDPALPGDPLKNRIKHSLCQQFIGGFIKYAAEKEKMETKEIEAYTLIFTTLCGLVFKIGQRQDKNQPFADLIKTGNSTLNQISRKLPVGFKISN